MISNSWPHEASPTKNRRFYRMDPVAKKCRITPEGGVKVSLCLRRPRFGGVHTFCERISRIRTITIRLRKKSAEKSILVVHGGVAAIGEDHRTARRQEVGSTCTPLLTAKGTPGGSEVPPTKRSGVWGRRSVPEDPLTARERAFRPGLHPKGQETDTAKGRPCVLG